MQRRYATAEYQLDGSGAEPVVYYRFGGRVVAWRNNSGLRYLLGDHLGSTHREANESGGETGQRRYRTWGSDRDIGLGNLTREERYTGQRRIEAGAGPATKELSHYGARCPASVPPTRHSLLRDTRK